MSRWNDPARLQKEIDAQKKRAEALALLNSQGGERHYKPGEIRKARESKDVDNTLEAVTLRRAQQTYRELSAKDRLLQQQNTVRESVQNRQKDAGAEAPDGARPPLRDGWKEVKDTKTGSTYYWNKALNSTTWERPEVSAEELAKRAAGEGAETQEKLPPLPVGWTEVKDPSTGRVYFWNEKEAATTWVRPTEPASGSASGGESESAVSTTPGLPQGWKAVTHAATGQTHYVNESTGERSFVLPGSQPADSSERGSGRGVDPSSKQAINRTQGGARSSEGRDRGAVSGARSKKRGRGDTREIDPLDPTGKQGGKWSDGLVQVGERMADSTASGPLWQQRPYPAPGKILRGRNPTEGEAAGPRQRG
ncbi:unnamed protein product [Ascophyllum nodosum]